MDVTIRKAQLEDAHTLAQAEREIAATPGLLVSLPSELTDERFKQTILKSLSHEELIYLVAVHGKKVVGHGFLEPLPLQAISHVAHLTLVVHAGWQGKGIGSLLLKALIDQARAGGQIKKIELHVRATNQHAIHLYRKMGFEHEGRLKQRVKISQDTYIDDIIMGLML